MIESYSLSIPFYLFGYEIMKYFKYTVLIIVLSSFFFFYFDIPEALLIFTALGLGINSIAPSIAQRYGANALNSGIALNIASVAGTIIPIVFSHNVNYIAFLTLLSMSTLLVLEKEGEREKKREKQQYYFMLNLLL